MLQLAIGRIELPETSHDKYSCYPVELGTQLDMISGRRVSEIRGHVQMVSYKYDWWPDQLWRSISAILRSGEPFEVVYLPDDSSETRVSVFVCESMENPTFAFSRRGEAYWHGISFVLREKEPHD